MKALFNKFAAVTLIACAVFFAGCKQEEESFTGLKVVEGDKYVSASSATAVCFVYISEDKVDNSKNISYSIEKDSTGGAVLSAVSAKSSQSVDVTVGNKAGGLAVIKAECNGAVAYTTVGVTPSEKINLDDAVPGFAGCGVDMSLMTNLVIANSPELLKKYATQGGNVIYVSGTIDMSEGILPAEGKKMDGDNATAAMNEFISANSSYKTYKEWINGETKVDASADTKTSAISNAYKSKIQIQIASNTAIIGLEGAVIRGVNFSIRNNNIVLRNLSLKDSVDPFPHHEKGDGWNAQHDLVSIDRGTNVWIDHCTFEDTLKLGTAANSEKWQVYDGLCDMKSSATNITVSYCVFKNHDKTMLIGSGDTDGDNTKRFITLANNYWLNCGQRCPFVRNSRIHIYNNVYDSDSSRYYNSQTSINARAGSIVCAQNNYIGGVASPNEQGGTIFSSDSAIFDLAPRYGYIVLRAEKSLKDKAGAGKLDVQL